MLSLDQNRPIAEICGHFEEGDPMNGAKWAQDGFLFNNDGELLESALTEKDKKRLEEILARNEALDAAKKAFMEKAPTTSAADLDRIINTDLLNKAPDDGEIDLVAWARGEKAYNYGKVAKAFRDRFHQSPVNKKQGLEILAEHGLIPPIGGDPTIPSQS